MSASDNLYSCVLINRCLEHSLSNVLVISCAKLIRFSQFTKTQSRVLSARLSEFQVEKNPCLPFIHLKGILFFSNSIRV